MSGFHPKKRASYFYILILYWIGGSVSDIQARSSYVNRIPNGSKNRCANCHIRSSGGGPRNAFGLDVATALRQGPNFWSSILASLDSDGDGFTNGEELGDADGDGAPEAGASVTLPGDSTDFPEIVQPPVDNEAPTIVLVGEEVIYLTQGSVFLDPGSLVSDNVDTALVASVSGTVQTDTVGTYTLTYAATDAAGNQSVVLTLLIHVTPSSTTLHLRREGTGLVLEWEHGGHLQWAPTPAGPWTLMEGAASPHSIAIDLKPKFFRVR